MWNKIGLGLVTFVLISFVYVYFEGKSGKPDETEYTSLNKQFTGYDRASAIATKALFFINIRTADDYKKLETEKSNLSNALYSEYVKGKAYVGVYRKDVIDLLYIKGEDNGTGVYTFKLDTTINGEPNIILVIVDNNIIKEIRSLGDV